MTFGPPISPLRGGRGLLHGVGSVGYLSPSRRSMCMATLGSEISTSPQYHARHATVACDELPGGDV